MEKEKEDALAADSTTLPIVLKPEDQLKHYQEGRTDVRSYAGFLIQVITLLLTTMILVMGWVTKDYATEKYRLAQRAVNPQLVGDSPASPTKVAKEKPIYELPPAEAEKRLARTEKQLDYVNRVYWHLLLTSPTTSLLLAGFSGFMMLVLGMLIAITYQLQRRRYHYHALGLQLGLESDQPIADAVLIRGALNDLMVLIGIAALALIVVCVGQTVYYIRHTDLIEVKLGLGFVVFLVIAKSVLIAQMVFSYTHFERTEGWRARWRRALRRVEQIQSLAGKYPACPQVVKDDLERLAAICAVGGKSNWESAKNILRSLYCEVKQRELGDEIEEHLRSVIVDLRHNKILRHRVPPVETEAT